jgi:hypothetical protein
MKGKVPWKGWKNEKPSRKERVNMYNNCGKKCFLGSRKSFVICKKNTCNISKKGVWAAYVRARQYSSRGSKYRQIAKKAKHMLTRKNIK